MAASSRPAAPCEPARTLEEAVSDRRVKGSQIKPPRPVGSSGAKCPIAYEAYACSMSSRFACWSSPERCMATRQQVRVARLKRRPTGAPAVTTAAATRSDPSPAGRRRHRARRHDTRQGGYCKSGRWSLRRPRPPGRSNDRLRSECLGAGDRRTRPECDRDRRRPPTEARPLLREGAAGAELRQTASPWKVTRERAAKAGSPWPRARTSRTWI